MIEIAAKLQGATKTNERRGRAGLRLRLICLPLAAWQSLPTKALSNIADKQEKIKENTADKQEKARGAHTLKEAKKEKILNAHVKMLDKKYSLSYNKENL